MAEFFKFGKLGKEVTFEQFASMLNSADVKKNKKLQKFFSLFDINGNGVIDTESSKGKKSEARSLFDKLREAALSNKNTELEESELISFIKESGITDGAIKVQKTLSALFESISTNPVETLETYQAISQEFTPEEIQDIAITSISDDVINAKKLFAEQVRKQGMVSDFVDDVKETYSTSDAAFKINQLISEEELCASLLQQAKDGTLTQKEYLEQKLKLAESLLIKDIDTTSIGSLSKFLGTISTSITGLAYLNISHFISMKGAQNEQAIKVQLLRDALKNLKPDELNSVILKAASAQKKVGDASKVLEEVAQKYLSNFKIDTLTKEVQEPILVGFKNPITGKITPYKEGFINSNTESDSIHPIDRIPVYKIQHVTRTTSVNIEQINPVNQAGSVADEINTKGERQKTFEETFRDERGVEYNSQKIMEYTQKNANAQLLIDMNNKKQEIYNILHNDTVLVDGNNKNGVDEQTRKISETRLENSLIAALTNLYGKNAQKIQDAVNSIVKNNSIKVIANENGEFVSLDYSLSASKSYLLVELSNKLQSMLEINYKKALGGKSLEEHINETSETYKEAYGDKNSKILAEGYIESQEKGVQTVKSTVQTGGMVIMIAGQAMPVLGQSVTMAGLITSTIGGTAVDALENYTKEGGPTEQDKQDMLRELGVSLALVGSGIGTGKMSERVFRTLVLRNCPKLLAFASEVGVDAAMSMIADYVITGQIDLSGEGLSQLQAILTGLIRSKGNFKTYLNTHVGGLRPSQSQQSTSTFGLISNKRNSNLNEIYGTSKEAEVRIQKFLHENSKINSSDFKKFVESLDFEKIYQTAPQIKNYSVEQKELFLKMHFLRGTKDFSTKDLTLPDNLTELLSKQPITGKDLDDLITVFPLTKPELGSLPSGLNCNGNEQKIKTTLDNLVKTIMEQDKQLQDEKIDKFQALDELRLSSDEWSTKTDEIYKNMEMLRNRVTSEFARELTNLTGKQVDIQYLGAGTSKLVFKISIEDSDPVVINIFHGTSSNHDGNSGLWYEVPLAPFLNMHSGGESDNFAHFFYGKYAEDGYSIVQYIDDNSTNKNLNQNIGGYVVKCGDNNAGNKKSNVIVDFGKMGIHLLDGTKHWNLEDYIIENKDRTNSTVIAPETVNTSNNIPNLSENMGFVSDTWNALKKIVFPKQAELEKAKADLKELTTINPGNKIARKIFQEWILEGSETSADKKIPFINAGEQSSYITSEVNKLIFQGNLSETLTQRYEKAKLHLQDIIREHLEEIKTLAEENKNDVCNFSQGFVHILAKEVGFEEFEPKIVIDYDISSSSVADWGNGTIRINPNHLKDAAGIVQMLPHELMHILQFRDFIAEYGENGIRRIVDEHKSISDDNKDKVYNDLISQEYVQKLLKAAENEKIRTGSVESYLNRLYLRDATQGAAEYKYGSETYKQKRTEQEAYYIGNNGFKSLAEWNIPINNKKKK